MNVNIYVRINHGAALAVAVVSVCGTVAYVASRPNGLELLKELPNTAKALPVPWRAQKLGSHLGSVRDAA